MRNENSYEQKIEKLEKWINIYQLQLETSQKETDLYRRRIDTFYKETEYMKNMIYDLQIELQRIHHSVFWKLSAPFRICGKLYEMLKNPRNLILALRNIKYIRAARHLLPKKLRARIVKKYFAAYDTSLQPYNTAQEEEVFHLLEQFEQQENEKGLLLVISGVRYVDSEGQRNIRLIHEARKMGRKVIFAYWRWNEEEEIDPPEENLIKIPIDILSKKKVDIFESYFKEVTNKCLIIEFPHPCTVQIVEIANSFGWKTIYDVIDDWEEFARLGQAQWYDKNIEQHIANIVDANIATAKALKEKIEKEIVVKKPYSLISNGVDVNRMKRSKKLAAYNFVKGNLQIGYFGHLTDAWFDWDMLKWLSRRHKDWTFHIIGYGAPKNLQVPKNIILYGKKQPEELPKYAAFWDVAVIPFLNHELTRCVNPIKVFEYLQLRLPVVASYMPEITDYPYVAVTKSRKEFEKAIISCKNLHMDERLVQEFVNQNTWKQKCRELMQMIDTLDKTAPFCMFP